MCLSLFYVFTCHLYFYLLGNFGVLNWSLGRGDHIGELVETGGSIVMFFFEFENDGIELSKHHSLISLLFILNRLLKT